MTVTPNITVRRQVTPALQTATWPEIDRSDRRLLLLPLGSTEQHGPHLPLNTDTVIASRLAEMVNQQLPEVGLAPAMPYGASGEHADFPGTLSIGTEALTAFLIEFTRHAATQWQHIVIVNGHGGNTDALRAASDLMRAEGRSLTIYHAATGGPHADAHAGFRETSIMMHLSPSSVRPTRAAGNTATLRDLLPQLQTDGVRSVSANGILGDPTGATAADGKSLTNQMISTLMQLAVGLL